MTDEHDAERIALSLPETARDGYSYRVRGKLFAWAYPERVHPKKARVPNPTVLSIFVAHLAEKDAMLTMDPEKFFTTDHYDGYPSVLVRLAAVDQDELTELITNAWRVRAPQTLVAEYDKQREGSPE